jgi:hypothetical protein
MIILFIPVGAQSLFSRAMDVIGAHQVAFAVDQISRGNLGLSPAQFRDGACSNQRVNYDEQVRLLMLQGNQTFSVRPVDSNYSEDLQVELAYEGIINAGQQATSFDAVSDIRLSAEITGVDEYTAEGTFSNVATPDSLYINLDGAVPLLTGSDLLDPDTYYQSEFGTSPEGVNYAEEIRQIVSSADDILTFAPSDILERDVFNSSGQDSCRSLDVATPIVSEPTTLNLLTPDGSEELRVRPVSFQVDDIRDLNLTDLSSNTSSSIYDSDKPFEYAKGQYENVNTITQSLNRIFPPVEVPVYDDDVDFSNLETDADGLPVFPEPRIETQEFVPNYTQDEFNTLVDEYRDSVRENASESVISSDDVERFISDFEEVFEGIDYILDINTYFDMATGDITALGIRIELKLDDGAVERVIPGAPETVNNIAKSGLVAETVIWGVEYTDDVNEVIIPQENVRDFSEL